MKRQPKAHLLALFCLLPYACETLWAQREFAWQGRYPQPPWVVRAVAGDSWLIDAAAAWIEPELVDREHLTAVFEVDAATARRLSAMGFRLELDEARTFRRHLRPTLEFSHKTGIPGFPCYPTLAETEAELQSIALAFPLLTEILDIGDSWEKVQQPGMGHDLLLLRLTNQAIAGPKPVLFVMSGLHARELAPAGLTLRFAEHLLAAYGQDADITWLLDEQEVHLLFTANPDGRLLAEAGASWRKNTDSDLCLDPDFWGVDLNRNFEFMWGCCNGSSVLPCDNTYRGPQAHSEPETAAIDGYLKAVFPDQRGPNLSDPAPENTTGLVLDLHSYGKYVLWPYGFNAMAAPNQTALQTLGRKLAFFNGYSPEKASVSFVSDGTSDDFAYGTLGIAAYTVELGTDFFEDCLYFEDVILADHLPALVYAAKAARAPYQLPAGPDCFDPWLEANSLLSGAGTTLTALIDDSRFRQSNGIEPVQTVAEAEFFIDNPNWEQSAGPSGTALVAADGSFDADSEAIEGWVNSAGLAPGRHTVFLRGRDSNGRWGAYSAAFLFVFDPAEVGIFNGKVSEILTGKPLRARVRHGQFHATSDAATGGFLLPSAATETNLWATAQGYGHALASHALPAPGQTSGIGFELAPTCPRFSDGAESGPGGWTTSGGWAISTESAFSGSAAWSDSPGGPYADNSTATLTSPVIDLAVMGDVSLSFRQTRDFQEGADYGLVEYSTDGLLWHPLARFHGVDATWRQTLLAVPGLSGQSQAQFRFRIQSDGFAVRDGWHIDDIELRGSAPGCLGLAGFLIGAARWPHPIGVLDLVAAVPL